MTNLRKGGVEVDRSFVKPDPYDGQTIVPTDIIAMICKLCGQQYSVGRSRLPITAEGEPIACEAPPRNPLSSREHCGSTDYFIKRRMDVRAAPRGTWAVDLSRKRS